MIAIFHLNGKKFKLYNWVSQKERFDRIITNFSFDIFLKYFHFSC